MKNVIIIGASGHAKVIIDILEQVGGHNIVGLVDSFKDRTHSIFGYQVLGTEDDLPQLIKTHNIEAGIIAIGDNYSRHWIHQKITSLAPGFQYISAIHPSCIIGKEVSIGSGVVMLPGVVVNADAKIGNQCIINTKSSVGHESIMEDFSSLSPGVTIGGNVRIGYCSAICLGVNVIESISIGNHSVIGAGSLVNKPIDDQVLAYGTPAKPIRFREKNEPYLGSPYKYKLKV